MNPSNNETGMQLPAPVVEMAPMTGEAAETAPATAEQAPSTPERAPAAAAQGPAMALPLAAPAQPTAQTTAAGAQSVGAATADDGDLIEKEWVNKAKQIVERTRDDPYKQSEQLTMVKVDYMKQRYGKTLKISS